MNRSEISPFARKVLLQPKHLVSGLRTFRSQDDGEEKERLIGGDSPLAPQSLHHPSVSPQLEVMGSPTSDLDDVALLQKYAQVAQGFLSTLPLLCPWLGPEDIELADEHPVAAGGFADILKAEHNGRSVVFKAYRCYRSSDMTKTVEVRCDRGCLSPY